MAYRVIQSGLGDFGRRWLSVLNESGSWDVAAVATRNADVRRACGESVGVPEESRFVSIADALQHTPQADALLVTTPHFRHADDIALGLEHGLHILVEKPLAGTWEECKRILKEAKANDRIVMVAENYRYGSGARIAREIVASGEIGVPELISLEYFVGHEFPEGDWRNDYTYPLLVENATHQFDLVRYVTGSNAENVFCMTAKSLRTPHWESPSVTATFEMSGGLLFQFTGSWSYDEFVTPWEGNWRLHGSDGSLSWQRDQIVVQTGSRVRNVPVHSEASDFTLRATLQEFTAALEEHRPPETSIDDNMQTVAMVYGAIRSAEAGSPVSITDLLNEP